MAKTAPAKSAATTTPATPIGNQMPTRVPENEQQAGAKIGSELAATGDGAVRVAGTDPKNNADTELGKNSNPEAPGGFGADVRGTAAEALSKQGGYQGETVTSIEAPSQEGGYLGEASSSVVSAVAELKAQIGNLERRVSDLEDAETAPASAGNTLSVNPLNTEVNSMQRALKRAGIQPHPELDELEIKREQEEREKSAAASTQVE